MCLLALLKSSNLFLVGLACRSCIKWKKGFHIEWKTISLLKEPHPPFILNFEHLLFSCFHSWLGRNKKGFCMWNQMNSGMLLPGRSKFGQEQQNSCDVGILLSWSHYFFCPKFVPRFWIWSEVRQLEKSCYGDQSISRTWI